MDDPMRCISLIISAVLLLVLSPQANAEIDPFVRACAQDDEIPAIRVRLAIRRKGIQQAGQVLPWHEAA